MDAISLLKQDHRKVDALFRRDENVSNYSLLANPLNPTTAFTNGPAGFGQCQWRADP